MKRVLVALLSLAMTLRLVACGGDAGVDNQPLVDAFNAASTAHAEVATLMNANMGVADPELTDVMIEMAEVLSDYKAIVEGTDELTQEDVDSMVEYLEEIPPLMATYKEFLLESGADSDAEPVDMTAEDQAAIAEVYTELATLYNEAATLATDNGWLDDELTYQELATVMSTVEFVGAGLQDPALLNGSDFAGVIEQLGLMRDAMPDLIDRVSVPYAG